MADLSDHLEDMDEENDEFAQAFEDYFEDEFGFEVSVSNVTDDRSQDEYRVTLEPTEMMSKLQQELGQNVRTGSTLQIYLPKP